MGGSGSSAAKPFAQVFASNEPGSRGPVLGACVAQGKEASSWRMVMAAPLGVRVYDAYTAESLAITDNDVQAAIRSNAPFTAASASEPYEVEGGESRHRLALGCQSGKIIVLTISNGDVVGPVLELEHGAAVPAAGAAEAPSESPVRDLDASVTVLRFSKDSLYSGSRGRCLGWSFDGEAAAGALRREYHLPSCEDQVPGGPEASQESRDKVVTPSVLELVQLRGNSDDDTGSSQELLWIGLDNGIIAVFDARSGILVRRITTEGPEAVVSLAFVAGVNLMFALSAHKRVATWDAATYVLKQKYQAKLMCGADLSCMAVVRHEATDSNLLLLAGVDGSLCARRIVQRQDGKVNCLLMFCVEETGVDAGCPITSIHYHAASDCVLLGDAGCNLAVVAKLSEHCASTHERFTAHAAAREQAALVQENSVSVVVDSSSGGFSPDNVAVTSAVPSEASGQPHAAMGTASAQRNEVDGAAAGGPTAGPALAAAYSQNAPQPPAGGQGGVPFPVFEGSAADAV
eukprot:TRINITY_DN12603_c0_g4_i1.p1 TRINITY_DN12603_c0_g4~~TRINITY_DN12603_c0_g4_i1.p1  ORF type:complete len:544 (-),score=110.80 TRINITY_DN12603_c0_g4_i1:86-1636(-)